MVSSALEFMIWVFRTVFFSKVSTASRPKIMGRPRFIPPTNIPSEQQRRTFIPTNDTEMMFLGHIHCISFVGVSDLLLIAGYVIRCGQDSVKLTTKLS